MDDKDKRLAGVGDDDAGRTDNRETAQGEGLSRREMIKIAAGAVIAAPLLGVDASGSTLKGSASGATMLRDKPPLFFSRQEFALVDELTELIIPADDHSPGARAAEVAAFIDARLAESFEDEPKQVWRSGLKLVDAMSHNMHGRPFMQATAEQRIAVLNRMAQNESKPKKPEELFFKELKTRTARAYYTSKIGIHTEMEYKGNTYLKEFTGFDAV